MHELGEFDLATNVVIRLLDHVLGLKKMDLGKRLMEGLMERLMEGERFDMERLCLCRVCVVAVAHNTGSIYAVHTHTRSRPCSECRYMCELLYV